MQILFHGSKHLFDRFSMTKVGTGSGTSGAGFGLYFTTSQSDSLTYGPYSYTVEVQLKNALSNEQITLQPHIIRLILVKLLSGDTTVAEPTSELEFDEMVEMLLRDCVKDTEIIQAIINEYGCHNGLMQILVNLGYTHSCDYGTAKDKTVVNYCIYDVDAIDIIRVDTIDTIGEKTGIDYMDISNRQINQINEHDRILKNLRRKFGNIENLNEDESKYPKNSGTKAKSKSQRRLFVMGLHYKHGKLPAKVYENNPALEKKLKSLAKLDDDVLHGYTNTFQKKRLVSGKIGKRNAIPERVPAKKVDKEKLKLKKEKEKERNKLAIEKAKKIAAETKKKTAAKKMKKVMTGSVPGYKSNSVNNPKKIDSIKKLEAK